MKYEISDDEMLAAISKWGERCMTYVARNVLSKGRPNLETAQVLRQLKRLEKAGKVRRVPSSYATQLCWSSTTAA